MKNKNPSIIAFGLTAALTAGLMAPSKSEAILLTEIDGYSLHMEVHTVGRLQSLTENNVRLEVPDGGLEGSAEMADASLQHAIGNLGWRLFYKDYYEVFFDLTIASRVKADTVWGHQGYILIKQMPEDSLLPGANVILDHIDVKAGHFVVDFGNEVHRRSLNADVQRNPLIGNPVISPHATEAGIEVIHQNERGFGAMIGGGSGVATDNYSDGARFSYRGKIWADVPAMNVDLAASYYRANHGGNVSRGANLFRTERLGSAYGGIWGGGGAAGQVTVGNGTDIEAWQMDLGWNPHQRVKLNGFFGNAQDNNFSGREDWFYYGTTAQLYLIEDAVYTAARFSSADARKLGGDSSNDGRVDRWQVGGGAWVLDGLLLKIEYVYQSASGFDSGSIDGVDLSAGPDFQGVIAEFSFSF